MTKKGKPVMDFGPWRALLAGMMLTVSAVVAAEPVSGPLTVVMVRPYITGDVYVQVATQDFCGTEMFMLEHVHAGFDAMYSGVLAAMMAGKKVALEARSTTGCAGWGTKLQSVYLYPN